MTRRARPAPGPVATEAWAELDRKAGELGIDLLLVGPLPAVSELRAALSRMMGAC